jgi:type IV pilus assembly protein PilW
MKRKIFQTTSDHSRRGHLAGHEGFTLIELLVSMVIFAVALTAIYTSYLTQQKAYLAQRQVTVMQQNLRAGMYQLERELRMAGYDPHRTAAAGFEVASIDEIQFTSDMKSENGIIANNERFRYRLRDSFLVRNEGGGFFDIAEQIEVLDFIYLDDSTPPQVLNSGASRSVPSGRLKDIQSVQITMVARAVQPDPDYRNTTVYRNQQGDVLLTANDHFRRRILTSTIRCRNMGL